MRRLFRADTPHDILSASIVAATLPPGDDFLAISTDKSYGDKESFLNDLVLLSEIHPWRAVVDISGLPINQHWLGMHDRLSRVKRFRDTVETAAKLRGLFDSVFGDEPPNELFLTCLSQPDIQMVTRLFPAADVNYCPHGLDCLHRTESSYYEPYCDPRGSSGFTMIDRLKRRTFGIETVPVRNLRVSKAFTFNERASWADSTVDLASELTTATMLDLFSRLAPRVQQYFRALGDLLDRESAILLLPSGDCGPDYPYHEEVRVLVEMARTMISRENASALVIKPHPLNSQIWVEQCFQALANALPEVRLVLISEYPALPIELVACVLPASSCGAIGSTSLRTLGKIYGMRSYCPEDGMLRLYSFSETYLTAAQTWIADNRFTYTAV